MTSETERDEFERTRRFLEPLALGAFGVQVWAFVRIVGGSENYGAAFLIAFVALAANAWALHLRGAVDRRRRPMASTRTED